MNYAKDIHFLADSEIKETKVTLEYLSPNKLGCKIESTRQTLKDHVTVQWMHNGRHMHYETLMIGNKTTSEARSRSSHDNNGSSWYQCIVRNGLRVLGMASVSKLVSREKFESPLALPLKQTEQAASSQRSPYFIYISPDQRISVGGSTKLKCIAGGNPLPRLEWRLNGKVLVWSYQDLWCVDFYFQIKTYSLKACGASRMAMKVGWSTYLRVWPQRPRGCIPARRKIFLAKRNLRCESMLMAVHSFGKWPHRGGCWEGASMSGSIAHMAAFQ